MHDSSLLRQVSTLWARIILVTLALLFLWVLLAGTAVREAPRSANPEESDLALYMAIAERQSSNENYYAAAIKEQLERGYPVQPATTVRLPTTTFLVTTLGPTAAYGFMIVLLGATVIAAVRVFERLSHRRIHWFGSLLLLAISLVLFGPPAIYFHETWAVLLLFLSLCVRSKSFWLAAILATVACLFRELALPFLIAMAAFEFSDKRFRRLGIWLGIAIIFLAGYALHVYAVSEAVNKFGGSAPVNSPSWLAFGGWPFIVGSVRSVTVLSALPLWVSALILPLALLGWSLHKDPTARSFTFAILGFVIPFLILGRPNNNYWALLYAPLLLPGFAYGLGALTHLVKQATRPNKPMTSHQ